MEYNQKINNKGIYAILLIISASIIAFITPEIITLLLFNPADYIAFISYGKGFILYSLSFVIAFIVLLVLYFTKKLLVKISISIIGLILFIYVNLVGINYSIFLDENTIEFHPFFGETEVYEWAKITNVFHELPTEQFVEKYIFEFSDGQVFEFVATSTLSMERKEIIYEKIMSLDVSYEEY